MTSLNISIFQNPKRSLVQGFLHGGRLMFEGGRHSLCYFFFLFLFFFFNFILFLNFT